MVSKNSLKSKDPNNKTIDVYNGGHFLNRDSGESMRTFRYSYKHYNTSKRTQILAMPKEVP